MLTKQNQVGENLITFELKVVFCQPHGVVSQFVCCACPYNEVAVALNDRIISVSSGGRGNIDVASIWHGNRAEKVGVNAHV